MSVLRPSVRLALHDEVLAVCRLDPQAPAPRWARQSAFWVIARTPEELSVICAQALVPPEVPAEAGWRALKIAGPLPFTMTGVMAAVAEPLADAQVSLFAVSTYDTDYLLVKEHALYAAVTALRAAGHAVDLPEEAGPGRS